MKATISETAILMHGETVDYDVCDYMSGVILKETKEYEGERYLVTWFFDIEDYEDAMSRRGIIDLPYEFAECTVEVA